MRRLLSYSLKALMDKDRRRQCLRVSVREHLVWERERERDEWRATEKEDRRLRKALKAFKGNEFYPLVDTMTREAFSWLCKYSAGSSNFETTTPPILKTRIKRNWEPTLLELYITVCNFLLKLNAIRPFLLSTKIVLFITLKSYKCF